MSADEYSGDIRARRDKVLNRRNDNIGRLKDSALEHLWIFHRQPSDLAETGGPRIFIEGSGCVVTDIDGKRYIDGLAGLAVRNIGYGRREIAEAVHAQMQRLSYTPWGSASVPAIEVAEKLAQITPGDLSRSFFASGGSEANETALKLARAYHRRRDEGSRYRFISRRPSFHGGSLATLSLGSDPQPTSPYEPLMTGVVHVPHPDPYRCPLGGRTASESAIKCAQAVEQTIQRYGPETVAALIAEPISGATAYAVPGPEYWPMLREICTRYGVLLIVDEVVTGFGRTGKLFGCEHWGVVPDIMTVGKGFTSGYLPMSAAVVRKSVADVFVGSEEATFRHIFTYGGHAACATAALANIRIIEEERLVENSAAMGGYFLAGLQDLGDKHPIVGDVRGQGLAIGVILVRDRDTRELFPQSAGLGNRLEQLLVDNGLILAKRDSSLLIAPPLCITREEVDEILSILDRCLGIIERELRLS
jgi:adenosylmethionine-8-amino-7-oxononanoate aminotransferase